MIDDILHHLPHSCIRVVRIRLDLPLTDLIVLDQAVKEPQHHAVHRRACLMCIQNILCGHFLQNIAEILIGMMYISCRVRIQHKTLFIHDL